jgi:hypothetical protein
MFFFGPPGEKLQAKWARLRKGQGIDLCFNKIAQGLPRLFFCGPMPVMIAGKLQSQAA